MTFQEKLRRPGYTRRAELVHTCWAEICALVDEVENWAGETHFQMDYPEIVGALEALDKKAGEE